FLSGEVPQIAFYLFHWHSLATLDRKNPRKTREILRPPAKSLGNLRNLRKIAQFRQNRSTLPLTGSTLVYPRCWRPAGTLHQPSALAYCDENPPAWFAHSRLWIGLPLLWPFRYAAPFLKNSFR